VGERPRDVRELKEGLVACEGKGRFRDQKLQSASRNFRKTEKKFIPKCIDLHLVKTCETLSKGSSVSKIFGGGHIRRKVTLISCGKKAGIVQEKAGGCVAFNAAEEVTITGTRIEVASKARAGDTTRGWGFTSSGVVGVNGSEGMFRNKKKERG